MNKVILEGHLGQDAEMRYMPNGNAVTNFSMATSETYNDKEGNKQEATEWHRIVVFGKLAEVVGKHARKGSNVLIVGKLKTRNYEKDGQKVYTTEVVLSGPNSEFKFLGAKPESAREQPARQEPARQEPAKQAAPDFDDDIPF